MKKIFLSSFLFLSTSFLLSALQGNLYFLPFSMPLFWTIILAYYSFRKSLKFVLLLNIAHCLVLISFSTIPPSHLIMSMNLFSLAFYFVKERFHTNFWHISLGASMAAVTFKMAQWLGSGLVHQFIFPNLLEWLRIGIITFAIAPFLVNFFERLDEKIQFERIDTLENLRI